MAKLKQKIYIVPSLLTIILLVLTILTYEEFLSDKYYPQTFVGDTNISFLTEGQAIRKLQTKISQRTNQKIQFGTFEVDIATSSANLDYSILTADLSEQHAGTIWERLQKQFQALFLTSQITPKIDLNLDKQTASTRNAVDIPYTDAQLIFDEITTPEGTPSSRIQVKEGVSGSSLDQEAINREVIQFILTGKYSAQLPTKSTSPKVTTEHILKAKQALEKVDKQLVKLVFDPSTSSGQVSWTIDTKQLLTLLDLTNGLDILDKDRAYLYLGKIAKEIDQEVSEGLFEFNPVSKKVSAFRPSQEGRKLDLDKTYQLLTDALISGTVKTINLPVDTTKPKIYTSDVNSLGIKELLGQGISHFSGSIPNRIYNINLTASKINGILIPPAETFSFNQTVGDISQATGFRKAYVIKEGRTVLDDGGGVCQDSTTLFRAVLNAGLPVVKRTAHAYRVGYYEQGFPPGLDATVFYPSVDFQFKNDTGHHILIQAYSVGTTLYVDLYGTSDGRVVNLTKPIVTNLTPPPPELRQDDPSLPRGTVKQVDWAAWGATVTFSRTVTRGADVLIKETFKSNYKAWQAVYLVGTQ